MSEPVFVTTTFGKWILAGEHAVIRGAPALVFPIHSRNLNLKYYNTNTTSLEIKTMGSHGEELELIIWGVVEKAVEICKIKREALKGNLILTNNIPIGAGMGASAALCVAIAKWFQFLGIIKESMIFQFSCQLENLFHGESSGVDIAVAMSGKGLEFIRGAEFKSLIVSWQPEFYISYAGKRGITKECVQKVKNLFESNSTLAIEIDNKMKQAAMMCRQALTLDEKQGFALLCEGISLANECFEQWGLVDSYLSKHIEFLRSNGAVVVKPTGSGGGGYVLSLWKSVPTISHLIKVSVSDIT